MSFTSFLPDILATVIGGIGLALLFFFFKEKVFLLPSIEGTWRLVQYTEYTQYSDYVNMELEYRVLLRTEGNKVYGTLEKVREKSKKKDGPFDGEQRARGMIEGYIEQNIFGKDRLQLHVYEQNYKRPSSTLHTLVIFKDNNDFSMSGSFSSTVANQTGKCTWQRIV